MLTMEAWPMSHAWYESTVWAFIGVAAAVVVAPTALFQLWQAWQERRPRRLVYGVLSSAPLLIGPSIARRRVNVTLDGAPLNRPQVVTLRLAHRGRRDIPMAAFDGALPMLLTLDTPILQILATDPGPGHTDAIPAVLTPDMTTLAIGPVTIRAGQQTTWTLLVDAPTQDDTPAYLTLAPPVVLTHRNPPLDTPTTRQDPSLQEQLLAPWRLQPRVTVGVTMAMGVAWAAARDSLDAATVQMVGNVAIGVIAVVVGVVTSQKRRRDRPR